LHTTTNELTGSHNHTCSRNFSISLISNETTQQQKTNMTEKWHIIN